MQQPPQARGAGTSRPRLFHFVCAVLCLAGAIRAQVEWKSLESRVSHGMAADAGRSTVVLFGGTPDGTVAASLGDTWERGVAGNWRELVPAGSRPEGRSSHALSYFYSSATQSGSVVMFGGQAPVAGRNRETWIFTGSSWTFVTPAQQPMGRDEHALAFDPVRERVVLFGGLGEVGLEQNDTWEWDGATWNPMTPSTSPSRRQSHAMAFDGRGGVGGGIVMFGGSGGGNTGLSDTWSWDGSAWTLQTPAVSPPGRSNHAIVYDGRQTAQRAMLFGGRASATQVLDDTWVWDPGPPGNWRELTPLTTRPPPRANHAMAFDTASRRVMVMGGEDAAGCLLNDAWEWDGADWRRANVPPSQRRSAQVVFEAARNRVLLHGGVAGSTHLNDTWVLDGGTWRQLASGGPGLRATSAMAYDGGRQVVVLFGGQFATGTFTDETWEWDGNNWSPRNLPNPPPARGQHTLVYAPDRGRVLMFGGSGSGGPLDDLWEYDGTGWQPLPAASRPPARFAHGAAYDSDRRRLVVFGGVQTAMGLNDTWEWDGAVWTQRNPTSSPPPRYGPSLVFDSARGRCVLFGGQSGNNVTYHDDTWEWDGTDWTRRTSGTPSARDYVTAAYDSIRRQVILFGGHDTGLHFDDTWTYRPLQPATYGALAGGSGCPGSVGTPVLAARAAPPQQLPWIGASLGVEVLSAPPNAIAVLLFGFSATSWLGSPLPLDLTFLGMTNCRLRTSVETSFVARTNGAGVAAFAPIPIPFAPQIVGAKFFNQALVFDAAANPFGATMSNANEGVVGAR